MGLTEETVAARIRQMIDRGIIAITAIFDWQAAGYSVDLWLRIECEHDVEPVAKAVAALDEVVYVSVVLGTVDIVAHVLLRDTEAALEFIAGTLTNIPGIARLDTSIGLETVKFFHQFARGPAPAREITLPAPVAPLGDLDWSIIDALVRNGRAVEPRDRPVTGVSDGTIRTRLRRMEDAGLIRVCAQVHPSHSGMIGARTLLALSVHDRDTRDVARALAAMPEVLTVSLVSGRLPIIAYVVASSRDRLVEIITDQIRDDHRGTAHGRPTTSSSSSRRRAIGLVGEPGLGTSIVSPRCAPPFMTRRQGHRTHNRT